MTRRLLIAFLSIITFVLVILEVPLGINFSRHERARVLDDLERDATVISSFAEDALEEKETPARLAQTIDSFARAAGERVVVVDSAGRAVVDSEPRSNEDFSTRPEIKRALSGRFAIGSRPSVTLRADLLYAAVPVGSGNRVHGAARVTFSSAALDARVRRNWMILAAIGLLILAATSAIGWALARSMVRPVIALEEAAGALAAGDLDTRAREEGPEDLRELARTFNDMAARLQALVVAQRTFVADASHELRTPLTALRLRLENLEDDVGDASRQDLQGAVQEARRMGRIVEGLLALARTEAQSPVREVVEVSAIVDERCDIWDVRAEEKNVSLVSDGADGARALAVPGHLEQILDNLIANALEAAPNGSSVHVATEVRDHRVHVHVVDQGPGLSDEDLRRAFDRFWRKEQSHGSGSGLGLAIARQLAIASGGDVELRRSSGGGLDAEVRLPGA